VDPGAFVLDPKFKMDQNPELSDVGGAFGTKRLSFF